jgi:GTPase SAR1 family protein
MSTPTIEEISEKMNGELERFKASLEESQKDFLSERISDLERRISQKKKEVEDRFQKGMEKLEEKRINLNPRLTFLHDREEQSRRTNLLHDMNFLEKMLRDGVIDMMASIDS